MPSAASHVLFQPIKVGRMQLAHRVVMAPLTRVKADKNHVHGDLALEYYSQRASSPGTLLITEGTFISPQAGGIDNVPGIYNSDQIAAWKRITDAVHAKGSFIFLQLWALGRAASPSILKRDGNFPFVSASPKPIEGKETPRELTLSEIHQYARDYAQAARNSIEAGFDGVEIHAANGYIIDQFLQDVSNERTDGYGGNIENRSRFGLEVLKAVVDAVGQDRTGIRLSPWSVFQDMRMKDPVPQFSHFVDSIKKDHSDLAYVHFTEAAVTRTNENDPPESSATPAGSNSPFRDIWRPRPFLSASNYNRKKALQVSQEQGDLIVFGKYFISNPDLPRRLKEDIPLTPWNYKTFYTPQSAIGYIDYPFAD